MSRGDAASRWGRVATIPRDAVSEKGTRPRRRRVATTPRRRCDTLDELGTFDGRDGKGGGQLSVFKFRFALSPDHDMVRFPVDCGDGTQDVYDFMKCPIVQFFEQPHELPGCKSTRTDRGDATWKLRGDTSRRRRGCDVATPRRRRGNSVETRRVDAAAATWRSRGDESRRNRIPARRRYCTGEPIEADQPWKGTYGIGGQGPDDGWIKLQQPRMVRSIRWTVNNPMQNGQWGEYYDDSGVAQYGQAGLIGLKILIFPLYDLDIQLESAPAMGEFTYAAAGTWIFRGDESRRRRGPDVNSPLRRAATPRPGRG